MSPASKFWIVRAVERDISRSQISDSFDKAESLAKQEAANHPDIYSFVVMESVATYRGTVTVSRVDAEPEAKAEEVKPEPRFKVGDRVRSKYSRFYIGVIELISDQNYVRWDRPHTTLVRRSDDDLEPLPPAEDPAQPEYEFWAKGTLPKKAAEYTPRVNDVVGCDKTFAGKLHFVANVHEEAELVDLISHSGVYSCDAKFSELTLLYRPSADSEGEGTTK